MLTNYVFMIPIKQKTTEVIKTYLQDVYSTLGSSKYILSDKGG